MVAAALGSLKPQPCLPFWNSAPMPEQMPMPWPLLAQQPSWQSASATHPPVVNCFPAPLPTSRAPELLGVATARTVMATGLG